MKPPLIFAGSQNCSVFIVDNQIVGWGHPSARYFFQMWRDLPSHVIYYRNLLKVDFLPDFKLDPIDTPEGKSFRYDYLAKGNVPSGFWIQFNAGIDEQNRSYFSKILYKKYSPILNNLESHMLLNEKVVIDPKDFLILLTNLGSSTGTDDILDSRTKNTLIGRDDDNRRNFNEEFFKHYFSEIKMKLSENPAYIPKFLQLSGVHVLAHLTKRDPEINELIHKNSAILKNNNSDPIVYAFLLEAGLYQTDAYADLFNNLERLMVDYQDKNGSFFMNK